MEKLSHVHAQLDAGKIKAIKNLDMSAFDGLDVDKFYQTMRKLGIGFAQDKFKSHKGLANACGMDSLQPLVSTASIGTPVQFLQNWLPGIVHVVTGARNIDDFVGVMTTGAWEDEQIVVRLMELTGASQPYGDYTNVPLSSWNMNFNTATNVRFELGFEVNRLEEARAARMQVDDASSKREAVALQLEIVRNMIGFYGYNSGLNNTYGFLNAPGLPSYITVASGVAGLTWSVKTFLEIQKDIKTAIVALRTQSAGVIDPEKLQLTLAVSTDAVDQLSTTSDFAVPVREWLRQSYPEIRVISAPELDFANGGANVFYLYADKVDDISTDDGRTFLQNVPAKFMVLGVQQLAKGLIEDYSNATSGVMCKRPWAVVRYSGI